MQKNTDNCLSINIPRIFKVYRDWAEVGKIKIVCLLHLSLPSTRHVGDIIYLKKKGRIVRLMLTTF
jgi:hypothetical protein